jgi:hypothetical protein
VVKGFCTESGIEIASTGIQVHGGMGYIEETGAAQTLRDVRITAIYEGTTGIQSNDFIGRKFGRDRGAALNAFVDEMQQSLQALNSPDPAAQRAREAALDAIERLRGASQSLLLQLASAPDRAMAVSVPFLKMCGYVIGGWLMARAADVAARKLTEGSDREFFAAKLVSARFYATQVLPKVLALEHTVRHGSEAVVEADAALI